MFPTSERMSMKAAFVYGPRDLRVEEAPLPKLSRHEVLVRVKACGICYSDVRFYLGLKKYRQTTFGRSSPGFTGHEWSGEVVEVGGDVSSISIGDRIVPNIIIPCGKCKPCRQGRVNLCPNKIFTHGGFAEYVKAPAENLLRIPNGLSFEEAAMTEPLACCLNAISRSDVRKNSDVIVIGDGFMGLLNMQLARLSGGKVIVVGHHDERLKIAEMLGAYRVVNSRKVNPIEEIRKDFPDGADLVIAAVGNRDAIELAVKLVGIGGTINIFAGTYPPVEIPLDVNLIHYNEIILTGSNVALPEHFEKALEILASRRVDVRTLITHRFKLEEISMAFEAVEKRKVIKAVIVP